MGSMTRGEWLMLATVGVKLVLWILAARSAWMPRRPFVGLYFITERRAHLGKTLKAKKAPGIR